MQQVADIVNCKSNNILFTNFYTVQLKTVQGRSLCSRHAQFNNSLLQSFYQENSADGKDFIPMSASDLFSDHTFLEAFDFCSINFSYRHHCHKHTQSYSIVSCAPLILIGALFNLSITHPYLFCEKQVLTSRQRSLGSKTVTSVHVHRLWSQSVPNMIQVMKTKVNSKLCFICVGQTLMYQLYINRII